MMNTGDDTMSSFTALRRQYSRYALLVLASAFTMALSSAGHPQEGELPFDITGKWLGSDKREYVFEITQDRDVLVRVSGKEREPERSVEVSPIRIHFTGAEIQKNLEYRGKLEPIGFRVSAKLLSAENFDPRFDKEVVRKVIAENPDFSSHLEIYPIDENRMEMTRRLTRIGWTGSGEGLKLIAAEEEYAIDLISLSRDGEFPDREPPDTEKDKVNTDLVREEFDNGSYRFIRKNEHGLIVFEEMYREDKTVLYSMLINDFYDDGKQPKQVSESTYGRPDETLQEMNEITYLNEDGSNFRKLITSLYLNGRVSAEFFEWDAAKGEWKKAF